MLFVAILGQLGAGGKALMKREVPGPTSEAVRPRVRETAVVMWGIYVGLSGLLTVILMLEGMNLYDALCHTFGTMATGGFSTRNSSIGSFGSPLVEGTIIVFMIAAGTNFSLYYLVFRPRDSAERGLVGRLMLLIRDPEFRAYLLILAVTTLLLTVSLLWNDNYENRSNGVASRGIQFGRDHDDHGLRHRRFHRVEPVFQGAAAVADVYRRMFGFHRRRHQSDSLADVCPSAPAGNRTVVPAERGEAVARRFDQRRPVRATRRGGLPSV